MVLPSKYLASATNPDTFGDLAASGPDVGSDGTSLQRRTASLTQSASQRSERSSRCAASCIHPEIQYEKPQFPYSLYQECALLDLISGWIRLGSDLGSKSGCLCGQLSEARGCPSIKVLPAERCSELASGRSLDCDEMPSTGLGCEMPGTCVPTCKAMRCPALT
eukprot:2016824-Rhodomonas_salina.2